MSFSVVLSVTVFSQVDHGILDVILIVDDELKELSSVESKSKYFIPILLMGHFL